MLMMCGTNISTPPIRFHSLVLTQNVSELFKNILYYFMMTLLSEDKAYNYIYNCYRRLGLYVKSFPCYTQNTSLNITHFDLNLFCV